MIRQLVKAFGSTTVRWNGGFVRSCGVPRQYQTTGSEYSSSKPLIQSPSLNDTGLAKRSIALLFEEHDFGLQESGSTLTEMYDQVIERIINDHKPLFLAWLYQKSASKSPFDKENSNMLSWDSVPAKNLLDMACDPTSFERKQIIKSFQDDANSYFYQVQALRMRMDRMIPPVEEYDHFVEVLYSKPGHCDHKALWNAYSALPTPQPLYIEPNHLEKLLNVLANRQERRGTVSTRAYIGVLLDMASAGMPIAAREQVMAITLLGESINKHKDAWTLIKERYANLASDYESGHGTTARDMVAALNAMLVAASRRVHRDETNDGDWRYDPTKTQIEIMNEFTKYKLEPSRHTSYIFLLQYSQAHNLASIASLLHEIRQRGMPLDSSMLTLTLECLVSCGEIELAEQILDKMVQQPAIKTKRLRNGTPSSSAHERSRLQVIDRLVKFLTVAGVDVGAYDYSLPLLPDFYVFAPFIRYYSVQSFEGFAQVLGKMMKVGLHPDRYVFYHALQACKTNSWTVDDLLSLTTTICDLHNSGKRYLLTPFMGKLVYKNFCSRLPDQLQLEKYTVQVQRLQPGSDVRGFLLQLIEDIETSKRSCDQLRKKTTSE